MTRTVSATQPTAHVEARADCPSGTNLLGTGARVFSAITADDTEWVLEMVRTQPCPAGTSAYGVGFSRFAQALHTRVDRAFPVADSTSRPVRARIHAQQPDLPPNQPPGTEWGIHRAAICGA